MRVKRGVKARRRRNKTLKRAKGYYAAGSRAFTIARERNDRALAYAFRDRKTKKREFRALWIQRINAAVRPFGLNYSKFINGVQKLNLGLDRKALSELAILDPAGFKAVVDMVQKA
ncbi:MAG: 50S ribosomal protein L20 [Bdellovibrionota bacterium]